MISRDLEASLHRWSKQYPAIAITGPRQSGKTTLARMAFPGKPYVNLEDAQERQLAEADPRGFLRRFPGGLILDEIQNQPSLLSQIQVEIDAGKGEGRYILTGSNQAFLRQGLSQSLAGRVAVANLYPFSLSELGAETAGLDADALLHRGFLPRIWDKSLDPAEALSFYIGSYVERDLRAVHEIKDIGRFQRFLILCAGRSGQLLNMASLASDAGISPHTVEDWLSLLQAGFIIFLLRPWHENLGKRLVKAPKLYFWDVGIVSWLLGNRRASHIAAHPLRGSLFENLVIADTIKRETHRSGGRGFYFWRDNHGTEVDLCIQDGERMDLVEIKSGQTAHPDLWKHIPRVRQTLDRAGDDFVVFGGDGFQDVNDIRLLGWREWMR